MTENVIRFPDVDRRSRNPDAVDRDPTQAAVVIVLPVIRKLNAPAPGGRFHCLNDELYR